MSEFYFDYCSQVRVIFLNWIPWLLLMNRPGHPLSLKSLMMKRTLRELPASSDSKSLLVKALDMEVDNLKAKDASSYPKSPITFTPLSPKFHISVIPFGKVSPSKVLKSTRFSRIYNCGKIIMDTIHQQDL